MNTNIFYWPYINCIGGVETFLYELAKKYSKDYDLTLYYCSGDKEQIRRLKQYIRVRKYQGEKIRCKKAFFGWCTDILDNIEAEEYYQMLHADYKAQNMQPCRDPRITAYLGVSKAVCDTFTEHFGLPAKLCYNPLTVDKPRKMLRLISATRLTKEKGGHRIAQLAQALENAGIPYTWEVFTNSAADRAANRNPNIIFRDVRLDIRDQIANADYLVQLSDTEAYSYSIIEALALGTPVIVTPWPCIVDLGVLDGVNGFVLPFDMSEIPVERIYKGLKKFKYSIRQDCFPELLAPGKGDYAEEKNAPVRVRCITYYFDVVLQAYQTPGMEQTVSQERADKLEDLGVATIVE
jgi:glycosyltransferase involved in cell wall biosynthesis